MISEESSVTLDLRDEFSSNILPRKTRKKNRMCHLYVLDFLFFHSGSMVLSVVYIKFSNKKLM
jgi:hypothetical protein